MTSTPYNQAGDYIPRQDGGFRVWGNNFARNLEMDPEHFGLTPADVAQIAMWAKQYDEAYAPAQSASTRTSAIVRAKNELRAMIEPRYRDFAQRIKRHPGVSFHDLQYLGIHIDDVTRTRIGAPVSAPLLKAMLRPQGGYTLRYADENSPTSNRKPHGVSLIQVYAAVGPRGMNVDKAVHIGDFGRQPIHIRHEMLPSLRGRVVTFYSRWMSRKGLKGPWSDGRMVPLTVMDEESSGALRRAA